MDLDHENVVRYYEIQQDRVFQRPYMDDTRVSYIVMERVGAMSLFDYIVIDGEFSERICRYFFR